MSSPSICGFIGDVCSVETRVTQDDKRGRTAVTEVITEVAEQIGFSDVKAKHREAILAFLSGKDTFCFYSHFCFCFYVSDDESGSVVWLMLISLRISSVRIFTTSP